MVDAIKARLVEMELNWDEVKIGIERILPTLQLITQMTTNKYDDLVVQLLQEIVKNN